MALAEKYIPENELNYIRARYLSIPTFTTEWREERKKERKNRMEGRVLHSNQSIYLTT